MSRPNIFVVAVVDSSNFTLKTTLKENEILISKQLLADLLGVLADSKRLYDEWFDIMGLKKSMIMRKFFEEKNDEFKSKSLTSFWRIVHWISMHSVLPRAGTYQEINDHELLVIYFLWKKIPLSLSSLIINHMIMATKPIKSTSSVPNGMLMTLVFKHFGVPLEDEAQDEEMLTWGGEKNVATLKLNPQPWMKKTCTCSNKEYS